MKSIFKTSLTFAFLISALLFSGCSETEPGETGKPAPAGNESAMLYDYLLQNGDYINSDAAPAIMTAAELYASLSSNIHIIDLRESDQFNQGHIEAAVNVQPSGLIDYFEHRIDAPYFDRIVFICSRGQLSAYVNGIMRLLGYNNTYSVRYGMSSWNTKFAGEGWDKVTGTYPGNLTRDEATPLPKQNGLPQIATGGRNATEIVRLRAKMLLDSTVSEFLVTYQEIEKYPEKYDVVAYVPADWHAKNVRPAGTLHFNPKTSLKKGSSLDQLSPDRPVAVYCFNGHSGAQATAWLRMMGFDAYSIIYGANSFMYELFDNNDKNTPRYWSDAQKNDFPVKSGVATGGAADEKKVVVKQTQGGCA